MFVYGVNFKVKATLLLYPKHLVDVDESLELGKGDELVRLEMKSLDLGFDGRFCDYINVMKIKMENIKNG
jgi:hypothetical protein